MPERDIPVNADSAKALANAVFLKLGLPQEDAEVGADSLYWANIRGVDSHGIQWLPRLVQFFDKGWFKAAPDIKTVSQTAATALWDADRGLGAVVISKAMKLAIEKARAVGIGWVNVRNMVTPLAMGYCLRLATREGMAAIDFAGARPNMVPPGGRSPVTHNAPMAIAVPGTGPEPVLLDMATSVAAFSWVDVARDRNAPIPPNWALDKEARPTTDPHKAAYARPMGDYKGYGLSFMIECLGALLAGDPQVSPVLKAGVKDPRHYENGAVCAINIGAFSDVRQFRLNVDELVSTIKAQPKAEGSTEIFVPGEIEERRRAQRLKDGIPLPEPTYKRLVEVARRFDVQPPQVVNQ